MTSKAYMPLHALRPIDIDSILSVAFPSGTNKNENERRYDYHNSRRTMLHFLLSMDDTDKQQSMDLINQRDRKIDWNSIQETYKYLKMQPEPYQEQYQAKEFGDYWELKRNANRRGPEQSRYYISKHRQKGFEPNELKLYWNYKEIENINKYGYFNPITDTDTKKALKDKPVNERANSGTVQFHLSGIEQAVFHKDLEGKQIIVLDFADERMPGGYFLENARTQEEVILYNSDGYRALLDLKYQTMDGGYMLPQYGLAYIKRVRFFQNPEQEEPLQERVTDLIVAACYDLSGAGEGLYKPPSREMRDPVRNEEPSDLYNRTYQKFQAIIASAVANTEGDGSNTYLLLGPIGTGAFGNDEDMI
ncbi:unnamed protein product, partial [Adineta steineri]